MNENEIKNMAKKSEKKESEHKDSVTNDDFSEGKKQLAVTNSCVGKHPVGPSGDLKNIYIESLIRTIRGQKVMLDSDLAMLYGVENKRLNEQVKRNRRFSQETVRFHPQWHRYAQ